MCKVAVLTRNSRDIEITVACEPEHIPIEGNASAIDPKTDAKVAKWIKDQLARGNDWAWCTARVRVSYRGVLSTETTLGACSYKSEKSFRDDNGYYGDMVDECLAELNKRLVLLCGPRKKGA